MNSIAKSPKLYRSELNRFVHKPHLLRVTYPTVPTEAQQSTLLVALQGAYQQYDLKTDPYVVELRDKHRQGHDSSEALEKVFLSGKTYCKDQLRGLVTKAEATCEELGPSPTDWYLRKCIEKLVQSVEGMDQRLLDWSKGEKAHLSSILRCLLPPESDEVPPMSLKNLSPKVESLIDVLVSEAGPDFTGLVFVKQRIWVAILSEILSVHPRTKDLFRIGTFTSTTSTMRKFSVAELASLRNEKNTLDDFRAGSKNLIIATSVLEEGIDISSCHLVICFERPENLKSFIQRRGRARRQESKYFIFEPNSCPTTKDKWEKSEEEMKAAYLDDLRKVEEAEQREREDEEEVLYFEVPSTG